VKERKTSGMKAFSGLARPLASAYVCLCGHRVRVHPASNAAIKLAFPIGLVVTTAWIELGRCPTIYTLKNRPPLPLVHAASLAASPAASPVDIPHCGRPYRIWKNVPTGCPRTRLGSKWREGKAN